MSIPIEQSIKAKIKQIAQTQHLLFNEVWNILVIERFLARLSHSDHKADFILKGGQLLAQYVDLQRQTKDLDFLIRNIDQDRKAINNAFKKISDTNLNDGFFFNHVKMSLLKHEHMRFPGLRIVMKAILGKTNTPFTIDVGFGDVVDEKEFKISLLKTKKSPLFEDRISLQVYPPEFIFSEKLEAAVFRGLLNSRMKDYHDLYLLIESKLLKSNKLSKAIKDTFKKRETELKKPPLNFPGSIEPLETRWRSHLRILGEESNLPNKITDVITRINSYVSGL